MNASVKRHWVEALRSGEYRQGKRRLHRRSQDDASRPDEYCCLGVLCALAAADGVVESSYPLANDNGAVTYDRNCNYLPSNVSSWAGLTSKDPVVSGFPLSTWNDGDDAADVESRDFGWIADAIEEYL